VQKIEIENFWMTAKLVLMDAWLDGSKTWGEFNKAIYTLRFKFVLCAHLFSLI
jgi:hypothetical protein